jgi:hypothetical protein
LRVPCPQARFRFRLKNNTCSAGIAGLSVLEY